MFVLFFRWNVFVRHAAGFTLLTQFDIKAASFEKRFGHIEERENNIILTMKKS